MNDGNTGSDGDVTNYKPTATDKKPGKITIVPDSAAVEQAAGIERERVLQVLRDSKPSFLTDGFGLRGRHYPQDRRTTDFPQTPVSRQQISNEFPPDESTATTQVSGTSVPNITFLVSDASNVVAGQPNNRVLVADGKINGVYPSGFGGGNFILDLNTPEDALIYFGVTFNPTTLAETSRFCAESTSALFPESRVESATEGFLYWLQAFTYFDANGVFQIRNVRAGDINFQLVYGAQNGKPALLPVNSDPGWLDLDLGP